MEPAGHTFGYGVNTGTWIGVKSTDSVTRMCWNFTSPTKFHDDFKQFLNLSASVPQPSNGENCSDALIGVVLD